MSLAMLDTELVTTFVAVIDALMADLGAVDFLSDFAVGGVRLEFATVVGIRLVDDGDGDLQFPAPLPRPCLCA